MEGWQGRLMSWSCMEALSPMSRTVSTGVSDFQAVESWVQVVGTPWASVITQEEESRSCPHQFRSVMN